MSHSINECPTKKTTLLNHIQALRNQLIHTGICEGLNNDKTIYLSQKLDEYIYLYQKLQND